MVNLINMGHSEEKDRCNRSCPDGCCPHSTGTGDPSGTGGTHAEAGRARPGPDTVCSHNLPGRLSGPFSGLRRTLHGGAAALLSPGRQGADIASFACSETPGDTTGSERPKEAKDRTCLLREVEDKLLNPEFWEDEEPAVTNPWNSDDAPWDTDDATPEQECNPVSPPGGSEGQKCDQGNLPERLEEQVQEVLERTDLMIDLLDNLLSRIAGLQVQADAYSYRGCRAGWKSC